jgi:hypothetical protein
MVHRANDQYSALDIAWFIKTVAWFLPARFCTEDLIMAIAALTTKPGEESEESAAVDESETRKYVWS